MANISYVATWRDVVYVAFVLDVFAPHIVGLRTEAAAEIFEDESQAFWSTVKTGVTWLIALPVHCWMKHGESSWEKWPLIVIKARSRGGITPRDFNRF